MRVIVLGYMNGGSLVKLRFDPNSQHLATQHLSLCAIEELVALAVSQGLTEVVVLAWVLAREVDLVLAQALELV